MVRVFISSVVGGMENMRDAAAAACDALDVECLRSEPQPSSNAIPQAACLQLVRESDAVVLLLGKSYGRVQRSGLSATEEEFDEAVARGKTVFAFVTSEEMEPAQERFRNKVEGMWSDGRMRTICPTTIDLQREVTRSLLTFGSGPPVGEVDSRLEAALKWVVPPVARGAFSSGGPWLAVAWAPNQRAHLTDEVLFRRLPELACDLLVTGVHRLADQRAAVREDVDAVSLRVQAPGGARVLEAWFGLDGAIAVGAEVRREAREARSGFDLNAMMFLSPRIVQVTLGNMLAFVGGVLNVMDPGRVVSSGRLQSSLSRMGMVHLAEPRGVGQSVAIPMAAVTGDHDRRVRAPQMPETVVRPSLSVDSPLAERYVASLERALRVAGRMESSW